MAKSRKEGSLTVKQIQELERSAQLAAQLEKAAAKARRKKSRPVKVAVSLRLDADVLVWLKKGGRGYGTRANRILRERMLGEPGRR
jgi:uncharacterized protein (DUF4415 family)